MRPLLPSLREKKRYIAFEVISENIISDFNSVSNTIQGSVHEFIGRLGEEEAGMIFINDKWNEVKQRGLVRVNNKYTDHIRASLALIKDINGQKVIVRSLGVSGILKKAYNNYIAK
jgi:ribonuclease P/MRP protein subunit POP5